MLDAIRHDAAFALRGLRRSRVLAIVTILSVGIGVGATTAIVTLANTLLLEPPPGVGHPERLVTIGRTQDGHGFDTFSYLTYLDYATGSRTLSAVAAMDVEPQPMSLATSSGVEAVQGGVVSGNFFQVLEARPSFGRFFTAAEDQSNPSAVVVLSHRLWQARFASDPSIVGHKVLLDGTPFVVAGVAAERFQGPFVIAPDLWIPLHASTFVGRARDLFTSRQSVWLVGVARLADGASVDAAQSETGTVAARLAAVYPGAYRGHGVRVMAATLFPGNTRSVVGAFMAMLFAVAGLVLVIASMNVAGMLLARATQRRREIAVRLALGASRARLARQMLTETVMLFAAAGATGIVLAHWLVLGMMSLVPRLPVQLSFHPHVDWRVLVFALGASFLTGLAAGAVPALHSTKPALVPALKIGMGASAERHRLRAALLVAQLAFSMLLLVATGLFARALARAQGIDPGFDPHDVEITSLDLRLANYDSSRGIALTIALLDRVRAMPGVAAVSFSAMLPLGGEAMGLGGVHLDGRPAPNGQRDWDADWNVVTPGYFASVRIPLLRGRDFTNLDRSGAPDVAILDETFARMLWPGEDPIGRTFENENRTITVIGVARDAKYRSLGDGPRSFVYVPLAQRYVQRTHLLVRTKSGAPVASAVRRALADLAPTLPILGEQSLDEQSATSLFPQRVAMWVAGSLGGVALLLALLGVYGVTALSVAQRTREIGVRVALGALHGQVIGLVLRQGVRLAAIGVALGAFAALGATRALNSLLYGVPPADPIAFTGAALVLLAAAVAASWIPARRAAQIDPMVALTAE